MKSARLIELLKKGNFVVPLYLFQLREQFSVTLEEFIFLVYLTNLGEKIVFDPDKISINLGLSLEEVMILVDTLNEKKLINVEVIKNDKGIMEEYITLDLFYEKVSMLLMKEIVQVKEEDKINVFEKIEQEFARTITSIEYEIIKSWLENGTSEELVLEALKEAVFNGVTNLRYMDKILYEWTKKGYKTGEEVQKAQAKYREKKNNDKKIDLFDYDWFEDEEE